MEIETLKLPNKRPPLPHRRLKEEGSQTTVESPLTQNKLQKAGNSKQKHAARFPPLHLPRSSVSLSRVSSEGNLSVASHKDSSKERNSTKGSIRSSKRTIRPSSTHRNQSSNENQSIEKLLSDDKLFVPNVSAHSWIVYEMNKGKCIHGKRIHKKREMASLTKIMNLITAIQIFDRLNIDPMRVVVKVSRQASNITGTTAFLQAGMQLSLYDLMFGIMLPSGNDAAFCMAEYLGSMITEKEERLKCVVYDVEKLNQLRLSKKNPVYRFVEEMNKLAKSLGMEESRFTNPHGLSQVTNVSTAENLARLCGYAMKNKLFVSVVNTKQYKVCTRIWTENQPLMQQNEQTYYQNFVEQYKQVNLCWTNTNKLLWEGWSGLKTGVTPNAGPCLAASVEKVINGEHFHILVILLSSSSMDVRWKEVKQIAKWAVTQNLIY